mmetsp:Transcript_71052/g.201368  ORF Transcript_71052/g.201368 Transcript_71052/m.201368 type:complete len:200 (-) Transcript_71052:9-608(-)
MVARAGLAGRHPEPALRLRHETLRAQVKLPQGVGIAATRREPHEAELGLDIGALVQQHLPVPDPALALLFAKRVHVEYQLPRHLRGRPPVLLQRAPAPDAPHVLGVLPEVVVELADLNDSGNLVLALEHLQDAAVGGAVVRVPEGLEGRLVLLLGPRDALLVVHLLQPEVRVLFSHACGPQEMGGMPQGERGGAAGLRR